MLVLSPLGGAAAQFLNDSGKPLSGGKLHIYEAGTTTPAVVYMDSDGTVPHANPIILDSAGRIPGTGQVWVDSSVSLKFALKTSVDATMVTWDNISIPVASSFSGDTGDFSGTLHAGGDFSVGEDKFGVDAVTGDVSAGSGDFSGTLHADGDFSVGVDKFVVDALTGDVDAAGAFSANTISATEFTEGGEKLSEKYMLRPDICSVVYGRSMSAFPASDVELADPVGMISVKNVGGWYIPVITIQRDGVYRLEASSLIENAVSPFDIDVNGFLYLTVAGLIVPLYSSGSDNASDGEDVLVKADRIISLVAGNEIQLNTTDGVGSYFGTDVWFGVVQLR